MIDGNACVSAEHLGHCSCMSLTKAAWCMSPQVACALIVDVPPLRTISGLENGKALYSAWQAVRRVF